MDDVSFATCMNLQRRGRKYVVASLFPDVSCVYMSIALVHFSYAWISRILWMAELLVRLGEACGVLVWREIKK